jgi:kynureninase
MPAAAITLADCERLDGAGAGTSSATSLASLYSRLAPGTPGTLYFDANSLGPMPVDAPAKVQALLDRGWREARRRSWNESDWLQQPQQLGAALSRLIGADADDVVVGDATSVNQYKLLRYALTLAAPRRVIVIERDVFRSNRYVAQGIAASGLADLRLVDDADQLQAALAPGDVAVVALSHVDYRNSRRLDMQPLNAMAHAHGALTIWDLSHSAGAVAIELRNSAADFALGCGYKYLCGGPGAPAFVYVNPRLQQSAWPAICGWMGHDDTFAFEPDFRPASKGVNRFLVGTPNVVANAVFSCAAAIWREVDVVELDARHRTLSDTLIALVEQQCAGHGIEIASPREHAQRGGHVALRFAGAQQLSLALCDAGVVVSARNPDSLRFGIHPIAIRHTDIWRAVERLRDLLASGRWRDPKYLRHAV